MTVTAGPFMIAAILVAAGGALKALRPRDTGNALRAVGVGVPDWVVRVGGAAEAVIGVYAIVAGDRWSAFLVAASYLAFTLFVLVALRRGTPIASCGCFGKIDTPPSVVHVVVDLAFAVAALVVVVDPGVGIADVIADQPLAGVPFAVLVAIGTSFAFLALTALPRTLATVSAPR
jgi:hypothetical protein